MSGDSYEGRDVLTGRATRVRVASGRVTSVEEFTTAGDLPWLSHSLVDLQVNGFAGIDVNAEDLTVQDIIRITQELSDRGTGVWVPTIITQDHDYIADILRVLALAVAQDPVVAASIPCAHIEGPFISPEDGPRGAHDRRFVRPISAEEVHRWHQLFPIGYVTVSPHWPDATAQISAIRRAGVQVAIGHTGASAEQVRAASAAGATMSTHLGNGMPAEVPRHPNLVWEQIADGTLDAGLIADGHHLPPAFLETVIRAKGVDHCFLVSDSVALAGSAPGRYDTPVGGAVVLSESGRLSLAQDQRLLAGSAVSLADCVRFAVSSLQVGLPEVFAMSTRIPGKLVAEMSARTGTGRITPGNHASLVLWDEALAPVTIVGPGF